MQLLLIGANDPEHEENLFKSSIPEEQSSDFTPLEDTEECSDDAAAPESLACSAARPMKVCS